MLSFSDPRPWRELASQMRELAKDALDPQTETKLLEIARSCYQLAERVEEQVRQG